MPIKYCLRVFVVLFAMIFTSEIAYSGQNIVGDGRAISTIIPGNAHYVVLSRANPKWYICTGKHSSTYINCELAPHAGPPLASIIFNKSINEKRDLKISKSIEELRLQIEKTYESRIIEVQGLILSEIESLRRELDMNDQDYEILKQRLVVDLKKHFSEPAQ